MMPDYKRLIRKKTPPLRSDIRVAGAKRPKKAVFSLLAFFALTLAAVQGVRVLLFNLPGFKLRQVSIVTQKGRAVSHPENFFAFDSDSSTGLFKLNIDKIRQDIEARHPELLSVYLRKEFPDKLLIRVEERIPVAVIASGGPYLVDSQGIILPFRETEISLPKIIGLYPINLKAYRRNSSLKLKKALGLLKELTEAGVRQKYGISQIDARRYSNMVFFLENGIKVKMGQGGFAGKALLLSRILEKLKAEKTTPKYIDMRFEQPVVKP